MHRQLATDTKFISIESLDNRLVFIRRSALLDIYLSSEIYGDHDPEEYESHAGIFPDNDFWKIVEYSEDTYFLEEEFEESKINEVIDQIELSDLKLDQLISSGRMKPENREKAIEKSKEIYAKFMDLATKVTWQYSSGKRREAIVSESLEVYAAFSILEIDPDDSEETIQFSAEDYHREIFINTSEIDYISIPKHKYHEGSLEVMEDMLNDAD